MPRRRSDLEIINRNAKRLNREAKDTLEYQQLEGGLPVRAGLSVPPSGHSEIGVGKLRAERKQGL
jgi:hypothetical protein